MPATDVTVIREGFKEYLKGSGLSCTSQRERILGEILSAKDHFDVEDLLAQLRRKHQPASRATVYRTIRHLEQSGFIRRVDLSEEHAHYEFTKQKEHHEHLLCSQCGAVVEFSDRDIEERLSSVASRHGFEIIEHRLQATGLCARCREKKG